jgi:hypothetical protein
MQETEKVSQVPDNTERKLDLLIDGQIEMCGQIKRMADIQEIQIEHLKGDIAQLREDQKAAAESRKDIYERIGKLERVCAARHGFVRDRHGGNSVSHMPDIEAWWAKKVVRWGVVIGGPVVTFLLTKLAERGG